MIKLTEKDRLFQWNEEQQKEFQDLKEMLSQASILVHPQSQGEFVLDTDASNGGIGAILSQLQDGEKRVVGNGSKMLTKTEGNYCITRRELLAIIHLSPSSSTSYWEANSSLEQTIQLSDT